MSWRSRIRNSVILALFSALLALEGLARGTETLQGQNPPTVLSQDNDKAAALKRGYGDFIVTQGGDDDDYIAKLSAGKPRQNPRFSYAKAVGTSDEAEETIHSIIFTAYKAIRANWDKYWSDLHDLQDQAARQGYSRESLAKIDTLYNERPKREMQIVEHAMAQLNEELTHDDFQRLGRVVRLSEHLEE